MNEITIIGICGGSCSGKTAIAEKITKNINKKSLLISQDNFYRGISEDKLKDIENYNFDIPESINFEEIIEMIIKIKNGCKMIDMPIYDFKKHKRNGFKIININEIEVIIIEGLLIFTNKILRNLFNFRIFIDTEADIRLIRRIERDVKNRGRTMNMVISRYKKYVRPAHNKYVESSKKYANIIIPTGVDNYFSLELISKIFK